MVWEFPYGELCEDAKGNLVIALDEDGDEIDRSTTVAEGLSDAGECGTRTVVVCPGRYLEAVETHNFGRLDLEIVAPGGPDVTVLDGWNGRGTGTTLHLDARTVYPTEGPSYELNVSVRGLAVTGGYYGIAMGHTSSGFGFPATRERERVRGDGNTRGGAGDLRADGAGVGGGDSEINSNTSDGLSVFARAPLDLTGTWIHHNGASGVQTSADVIGGLVERNGWIRAVGGGIDASWGDLTITGTVVRDNRASEGGGIYGWDVTLKDVTVEGNAAKVGGGLYGSFELSGATTVAWNSAETDGGGAYVHGALRGEGISPLTNNTAARGGGVFAVGGGSSSEVSGVWVADNSADEGGGILALDDVAVSYARVLHNEARRGGGIASVSSAFAGDVAVTLEELTLERNEADEGGALSVGRDATVLGHSIDVVANRATAGGAAWIDGDGGWSSAELDLRFSRVVENSADDGGGVALRGSQAELRSSIVDWGDEKLGEDNWPVDVDVNGAAFDGATWDTFECDTVQCVQGPPPVQ